MRRDRCRELSWIIGDVSVGHRRAAQVGVAAFSVGGGAVPTPYLREAVSPM